MRLVLVIALLALPVLAQDTNQNVQVSGKVSFVGLGYTRPAMEIQVDTLTSFEQGASNDLLTLTYLTNSTVPAGVAGWAYIGPGATFMRTYVWTNMLGVPSSVAINGKQYSTWGTRSAKYNAAAATNNETAKYLIPGSHLSASFGIMIQFCNTNMASVNLQPIVLQGPPWCACQQVISASENYIRALATTDIGATNSGGHIPISNPCGYYWITGVRDPANSNCRFSLYDLSTSPYTLVGESVTTMGTTNNTTSIQIGDYLNSSTNTGAIYWDNFVARYSDGFYPLGPNKTVPPAPPPPTAQLGLLAEDGTEIIGQSTESILLQ